MQYVTKMEEPFFPIYVYKDTYNSLTYVRVFRVLNIAKVSINITKCSSQSKHLRWYGNRCAQWTNKTLLNITFEDIIIGFEGQGHFKKV